MERAPGVGLFEFLARQRLPPERRRQLGETIAAAVLTYVVTLGEPHPDLHFDNVLFDAPSGTMTFVDLGAPQGLVPPDPSWSDCEITVGNLLGSVVFQSGRPRYILHRRRNGEAGKLAAQVVRSVASAVGGQLRPPALLGAARAAYVRCAFGRAAAPQRLVRHRRVRVLSPDQARADFRPGGAVACRCLSVRGFQAPRRPILASDGPCGTVVLTRVTRCAASGLTARHSRGLSR